MGRPVVAVRSGGLGEIVEHERTGLLVDADCGELANAVATLLEQPARAAQMGAAAWRRARSVFAEQRCVDAYDALYRRLAAAAA
jgi:glycosyltransferase involved in cell wall biosynthesis